MGRVYQKMHKTCDQCGSLYPRHRKFGKMQWASSRFCGMECAGRAKAVQLAEARPTIQEKFNALFEQGGECCWEWQGTIDGYGYGVMDHNHKRFRAHVLALEFDGRAVPKGMFGCHHCDNPRCVRPDHLYPGTAQDNSDDAVARKRLAVGEKNSNAKLTESTVRKIRLAHGFTYTDLARIYGVSRPTITRAVLGQTWRHVQ